MLVLSVASVQDTNRSADSPQDILASNSRHQLPLPMTFPSQFSPLLTASFNAYRYRALSGMESNLKVCLGSKLVSSTTDRIAVNGVLRLEIVDIVEPVFKLVYGVGHGADKQ